MQFPFQTDNDDDDKDDDTAPFARLTPYVLYQLNKSINVTINNNKNNNNKDDDNNNKCVLGDKLQVHSVHKKSKGMNGFFLKKYFRLMI